jgi:hypothetical protein
MARLSAFQITRLFAGHAENDQNPKSEAAGVERAWNPIAISDTPPTIILIPISSPIVHAEDPGDREL